MRRFVPVVALGAACTLGTLGWACSSASRTSTVGAGGVAGARAPSGAALDRAMDAYFEPLVRSHDFAGAVLVARGDRVLFEKGYGLANVEAAAPNTPSSVFRIASLSKTFTAAAIEMLVERGTIHYSDPLDKFLPRYPNGNRITVEQLLLHSSGVANPSYQDIVTSRISLDELVEHIAKKPPLFEPGTQTQYSNAGYVLLAAVVERASGMSYAEFIRRNITGPLGLRATLPDPQEGIVVGRAMGYVPGPPPIGVENVAWYDMSPMTGSGSLLSTVHDLHRWARAVHREELNRRTTLRYPYGWGVRKYYNRDLIEQSGEIDGFTSYLGVYFRDSTYVVCLTNIEAGLGERCGKDIAAIAFGERYEPATPAPSPRGRMLAAADTGRYGAASGTFRLFLADSNAFVQWVTARSPYYVTPIGTDSLFVSADRSVIVLERNESGSAVAAGRSWGGSPLARFPRQP